MENSKIQQLTISKIYKSQTTKAGEPIKDFNGKPATKVSIKTDQYPDKYLYSYPISDLKSPILQLQEKDGFQALVWEFNGYLNFKLPTKTDLLEARVIALEDTVKFLLEGKEAVKSAKVPTVALEDEPPMDEIDPENTPF